jgi:hypothetical protein
MIESRNETDWKEEDEMSSVLSYRRLPALNSRHGVYNVPNRLPYTLT